LGDVAASSPENSIVKSSHRPLASGTSCASPRKIRIHAIDIVQPPGIGISPIADMDAHQTIVTAALAAKSSAETPQNACWEARSETMRREITRPPVAPTTPTT